MLVPSLPVARLKCPFHIPKLLSNDLLKKQDLQFIILLHDKQELPHNRKGIHTRPATSYPQCGQLVDKKNHSHQNPFHCAIRDSSTHVDKFQANTM